MIRIREAIVVEGRYDAIRLHNVVDTLILETNGFGIFKDSEQVALLRRLAKQQGLLIFTDSDSAGFVIRNFLNGVIPPAQLHHAYIPEIHGKERRKPHASKEGLLGVEGVDDACIEAAIRRAGVTVLDEDPAVSSPHAKLTKWDLYADGLTGQANSATKRARFLALAGLPSRLSTNQLLTMINTLMTEEQYRRMLDLIS